MAGRLLPEPILSSTIQ
uniref:Uncharacterized protein n=1 Tax=Romanomermis culicivorax TaxID=13658 RepID=A0A915JM72_ROMCU